MLFGEHIINKGAYGLAIPYKKMYCKLSFNKDEAFYYKNSNSILKQLAQYIQTTNTLGLHYNSSQLFKDIENNLGFCMNIPVGYGLGSSGALVACLYNTYKIAPAENLSLLQNILAQTEGFFHGKSSGLDPLVSYLDKTVAIKNTPIEIEQNLNWQNNFDIYLLNSQTPRKTGPLVQNFLKKYNANKQFKTIIDTEIIPLNNEIINDFITNNYNLEKIKKLSELQLNNYSELISNNYKALWQKGLDSDEYYLKICGAGGGGFFLVFSRNKALMLENISLNKV